jgi:non-specific serine/threonine protein kinase/serine/threonine-protein kinase
MTKLGFSYWGLKKNEDAERLFLEALKGQLPKLGEDNPDTLQTMQTLGMLYDQTRRYPEGERMLLRVITISKRVQGEEHPFTVGAMNTLANLYLSARQFPKAEGMYLAVHAIQKRVRGEDHPNSLNTLSSLANMYWLEGKYADAEPLVRRIAELAPRALGDQNVISVWAFVHLAMIESQQGNFDRAEPLWLKVLAARRNGDRPDSGTLSNLAYTRVEQKKYSDAETVIRQSLATDQSLSPSSWNVFRDRVLLGAALAGQGKFQDGEPLLLSGFEGLIRTENNIPQDYRFYLAASEHWIDQLYQDWGRPDRAAEWKLKLQGLRTASFRK